jgi:hypothetical protein
MALGEGKRKTNRQAEPTVQEISSSLSLYNCIESLSEQSGAERRHLVKCKLDRREDCITKKKKNMLRAVLGKSAWKSVMNVDSAAREKK